MTTTRGLGGGGGGRPGARGGAGGPARQVGIRDLGEEHQRAHELVQALDGASRARLLAAVGASTGPLTAGALQAIVTTYARLDMPLTRDGIASFKADRGLVGGSGIAGPTALAYVRALDGNEVLFRLSRTEELALRPADKACLTSLRAVAKTRDGIDVIARLKLALGLNNPAMSADAEALRNEYVGLHTIREISHVTSMRHVELTAGALARLADALEHDKASTTPAPSPPTSPPATGHKAARATSTAASSTPAAAPSPSPTAFASSTSSTLPRRGGPLR